MKTADKITLKVETSIEAPIQKVWKLWTTPEHINQWNTASPDWHTPRSENNLIEGGKFLSRMEAKDGSMGFDFEGIYDQIKKHELIAYTLLDGRKVEVTFQNQNGQTIVGEEFEAEQMNAPELQQQGWQAILDNFKKYVEETMAAERMHFQILINADKQKVYSTMLDDKGYRAWTKVFSNDSHYIGSWEKGSKILFLGTDSKGNIGGMVSRIRENRAADFVSIEHLGMVQGDREITSGPEVDNWAGALENYTFEHVDGKTLVKVDLDGEGNEQFKKYFMETWPIALDKLKSISES